MSLHDPQIEKIFKKDRQILQKTALPIVTVTGAFQEDVKRWHGVRHNQKDTDIIYSRAHFSMAYGVLQHVWKSPTPKPSKAWLTDPTNFVSEEEWKKITSTEKIGELIARQPILQTIKALIDQFARKKLPILESITPPLLYLFEEVHQPILSFHIAAGNILAGMGKTVVQMITDPHVRDEYIQAAISPTISYCVFDEQTKKEFLSRAKVLDIDVHPDRIIVTGPPIDPRIIEMRKKKTFTPHYPLRLLITTGGLGTNKKEIKMILELLLPELKKDKPAYQLMLYAGTEKDFVDMAKEIAMSNKVAARVIHHLSPTTNQPTNQPANQLTILHHPQIFDANELLIKHGLPWADGVISKPSGDMAYDAVIAGCFLLTLKPWGVWEERIMEIFEKKKLSTSADTRHILEQLNTLVTSGWIARSLTNSKNIDKQFLHGVENIVEVMRRV